MPKTSQRKGATGERELAALLREFGYHVERGGSLTFGQVPDLVGLPGVHIEVKRAERLNVLEAYQQAERDAQRFQDGVPVLFHRRNRLPWLVTMALTDWLDFYKEAGLHARSKCDNIPEKAGI
jgi:Holliday junction resolvase - archaeal type